MVHQVTSAVMKIDEVDVRHNDDSTVFGNELDAVKDHLKQVGCTRKLTISTTPKI